MIITEKQLRAIVRECIVRTLNEDAVNEGKLGRAVGAAALGAGLMFGGANTHQANAQLNVKNQISVQPQKLTSLGMGSNCWLYKESDGYRIRAITYNNNELRAQQGDRDRIDANIDKYRSSGSAVAGLASSVAGLANTVGRYDDRNKNMDTGTGYVSLFLGKTEDSALQTLEQLVEIVETGIYKTEVSQTDGDVMITNSSSKLDRRGILVQQEGVEGYGNIPLVSLNNAIKYFGKTYHVDPDEDYFDDWNREESAQRRAERKSVVKGKGSHSMINR